MNQQRASKKQQELLGFVDGFIKGNGYGPSYREIMRALGYKSVSTVAIHVDGLITKGYLRRSDKSARSLEVVTLRDNEPKKEKVDSLESQLQARIDAKQLSSGEIKIIHDALRLLDINIDSGEKNETADDEK